MASTARNIIGGALSQIGVLGRGRGLSAEDADDGLNALNDMLSSWSAEGMAIPQVTKRDGLSLVAGQTRYTVSPTGDFAT